MPMTLASQRVSGNVSSIKTRKIVRGAARNAPGPPSSHAQKMKPDEENRRRDAKPRPISIGESAFSASMLITVTPAMTSNALVEAVLGEGQNHGWCYRRGRPIQGMKLKKKARMPHISGKSTLNTSSKTWTTRSPVTRLTWRAARADASRSGRRWSTWRPAGVLSRAGAQAVHHGRTLREQEQHDDQDQEQVAQEVGDAGEDAADGSGKGAGTQRSCRSAFESPRLLVRLWMLLQLRRTTCPYRMRYPR